MERIENFPNWLKTKRQLIGLSQDALSDLSGVSRTTIVNAEKEGSQPGFDTQKKLAEALGYKLCLVVESE